MSELAPQVAEKIVVSLKDAGVNFTAWLPDSTLYHVYLSLLSDQEITSVPVVNEAEGVCLCAGAWLGRKKPVMIMENSGILAAAEILSRLTYLHRIPIFMLVSNRGEIGDAYRFSISHRTAIRLLRSMQIPYKIIKQKDQLRPAITAAHKTMQGTKTSVAVLIGCDMK